jgi:FkbM family methyltransferase
MKQQLNKLFSKFGFQIHGIGYIQKLINTQKFIDPFQVQKSIIPCPTLIIDVGSNRGDVTSKYLELFPSVYIHAFEPYSDSYTIFEKLFGHNKKIVLNKYALSSDTNDKQLHINKSVDTNSFLESTLLGVSSDKSCTTTGKVLVKCDTLDNYCKKEGIETIDILKIDTQGFEIEVLKGASHLLKENKIKMIYCEAYFQCQYKSQPLFQDILQYLSSYNYVLQDLYDPYYGDNNLLWCDAIFVLKNKVA